MMENVSSSPSLSSSSVAEAKNYLNEMRFTSLNEVNVRLLDASDKHLLVRGELSGIPIARTKWGAGDWFLYRDPAYRAYFVSNIATGDTFPVCPIQPCEGYPMRGNVCPCPHALPSSSPAATDVESAELARVIIYSALKDRHIRGAWSDASRALLYAAVEKAEFCCPQTGALLVASIRATPSNSLVVVDTRRQRKFAICGANGCMNPATNRIKCTCEAHDKTRAAGATGLSRENLWIGIYLAAVEANNCKEIDRTSVAQWRQLIRFINSFDKDGFVQQFSATETLTLTVVGVNQTLQLGYKCNNAKHHIWICSAPWCLSTSEGRTGPTCAAHLTTYRLGLGPPFLSRGNEGYWFDDDNHHLVLAYQGE